MSNDETSNAHGIPPDDPARNLTLVRPNEDATLPHIGLVGDTYTILLKGEDTAGKFSLIDMHVPRNGGPPRHRHDFEETFHVLDGEIEATFRGKTTTVRSGETINIPANAPHSFTNSADQAARVLCVCSPPGQEEFFMKVGVPMTDRTTAPPPPNEEEQAAMQQKAQELAPHYRTELLGP